jgi:hypothetical protein
VVVREVTCEPEQPCIVVLYVNQVASKPSYLLDFCYNFAQLMLVHIDPELNGNQGPTFDHEAQLNANEVTNPL